MCWRTKSMLSYLVLLIAFFIAAVSLIQLFKNTPSEKLKSLRWKMGLSVVAIALILLAATGRIHWIAALIGAAIPLVRRVLPLFINLFPLFKRGLGAKTQNSNQDTKTHAQTQLLKMSINPHNNQLQGEVINGPYVGSQLDQLSQQQLTQLLSYCHQQEKDSARVLISYLNQRFGYEWQKSSSTSTHSIDENSAYAILGLKKGASRDEIIQAHRRIIQKVHPDRGGSDYLAAQINQAKDLLISKLT
jgi:hypothetical protein